MLRNVASRLYLLTISGFGTMGLRRVWRACHQRGTERVSHVSAHAPGEMPHAGVAVLVCGVFFFSSVVLPCAMGVLM
jgi:hypothetical protein